MMYSMRFLKRFCSTGVEGLKQEKNKNGLLRRLGSYLKMVLEDYKMVAVEIGQDIRDHPFKSTVYFALIGSVGYLMKTNPTEESFRQNLLENANELLLIGQPIRNPISESHLQKVTWSYNEGTMRRLNLGVCSLMWQDKFSKEVDVYEAHCKPLKVGWLEMRERVLDIGIARRWLWTERAMVDYDINSDEWPQQPEEKKT